MSETIYFCSHNADKYPADTRIGQHTFSNWYRSSIVDGTVKFRNVEQYMMYHKCLLFLDGNSDILEKIMASKSAGEIRALGRKIRGFDQAVWDAHKYDIVRHGVYLKFMQNADLRRLLLDTGTRPIAEAAWYDAIWGIGISVEDATAGKKWRGQNLLGKILMSVRDELSQKGLA